jgi:flavin reductase (DIM6/NTAB) family NADH-FMN oxidoreductase RutF
LTSIAPAREIEPVLEHAEYGVDAAKVPAFLAAIAAARTLLLSAPGCRRLTVTRSSSDPAEHRVQIEWRSRRERDAFRASASAGELARTMASFEPRTEWLETPIALDPGAAPFESTALRSAFGHYPTGIAVVTANAPEGPAALVVTSFTSVSLKPPLVSFCAAHTSTTWPVIADAGRCCINMLAASQRDLCRQLSAKRPDRFDGIAWSPSRSGAPVLAGVVASFDCRIIEVRLAGDHDLVLLEVLSFEEHPEIEPLLFHRSAYRSFQSDPAGSGQAG